jgi:hypothetical protein
VSLFFNSLLIQGIQNFFGCIQEASGGSQEAPPTQTQAPAPAAGERA